MQLQHDFSQVIESFGDTLPLFRKKFPGTSCSLGKLAEKNFALNPDKMHDAVYDVLMLQNVAFLHFTADELILTVKDFTKMVELPRNLESLQPLRSFASEVIIKRIAYEGIHYNQLLSMYQQGRAKAIELLEKKDCNGKKVIRAKKVMNNILSYFEQLSRN